MRCSSLSVSATLAASVAVIAAALAQSPASATEVTPAARLAPYKGYQQVISGVLDAPAASSSVGDASCSAGRKAIGGGAVISSRSSLKINISSSFPYDSDTWRVFINNAEPSAAGTFTVYVVCAKNVANFSVVQSPFYESPSGAQTTATVTCPAKTFPLGGGGTGLSPSTMQNLSSTYPSGKGWRATANNASDSTSYVSAVVVCGKKPTGYVVVTGESSVVRAGTQEPALAECPASTAVLSGGVRSESSATSVNLNSTAPYAGPSWVSYQNNASPSDSRITLYAICAQGS